ncbi:Exoenzymes regulatory protein AepA precursor [Streptomyces mobaraensis NBRC 13819 = DSM 40847]|uniref:Exoenzymes regulatory protein AepA n=1 Tax=Streptomyces mobaraensis (strain ATCC 29032 / DSM 40847 / JCM 4168 / NBRC 13819 / NCIMB 11159 / IPCR 16-22) TaxID=1223523 RepID=M3AAC1_STRM1|nr:amidohydrolase [Streptomyces mobaraensis]EMF02134.1 Exoenzymes regulatory protein AepA precursor [Streptomyces mobaraensis NBRC 13819 = DSM 40847]
MPSMPVSGVTPVPDEPNTPDAPPGTTHTADLVLRNAKLYTGDPARPAASALAVRDGRVLAVGDDRDVARHVGPRTRVVDALGRRAVPGLNDSHLHVIRGGLNYVLELRWDGVPSLRQALAMLREQAGRTPKGQWIRVVGGWTADQFAERRLPTPAELTAAAPDTPVFVLHLYQSAILNRAAVRAAGITRDTPDPRGGQIVRDRAGDPNGVLLAAPSALILYSTLAAAPTLDEAGRRVSTRHFLRELNRFGLTSAIDAAGGFQNFPDDYATVVDLARSGELSLRIAYHLFPQTAGQELADLRRWVETVRPGDGDEWLRLNGAGENLTWAAADFENFAEPRPELAAGYEGEFEQAVRLLAEHGWGFRLHATYDETIRRDLAVFEKLAAEGLFPGGNRWFFDHAETASAESLDRVAALGGGVSVQNRMAFQGRVFAERYGAETAARTPPVKEMLERGLPVAAGTDATRVSSYNPWVALHWLVTGRTVGDLALYPPDRLLSRETALALYTRAGARMTGEEAVKGVLKEGFLGDFAVLDQDYLTVPAEDIPHIESVLTVVGGRIVYAAAEYEGLDEALPPVRPEWSPAAHFGGYHATPAPSRTGGGGGSAGARQAGLLAEVVAASEQHRRWRAARGDAPERSQAAFDPCFLL